MFLSKKKLIISGLIIIVLVVGVIGAIFQNNKSDTVTSVAQNKLHVSDLFKDKAVSFSLQQDKSGGFSGDSLINTVFVIDGSGKVTAYPFLSKNVKFKDVSTLDKSAIISKAKSVAKSAFNQTNKEAILSAESNLRLYNQPIDTQALKLVKATQYKSVQSKVDLKSAINTYSKNVYRFAYNYTRLTSDGTATDSLDLTVNPDYKPTRTVIPVDSTYIDIQKPHKTIKVGSRYYAGYYADVSTGVFTEVANNNVQSIFKK